MVKISVVPSVFTGANQPGDFEWEIQTQYRGKATLYIFNDNVDDHYSTRRGNGNAVIRSWNTYGARAFSRRVASAGVSTGLSAQEGGF
mmetsp:Transcript_29526/g.57945  ORF Transcript_29526/g.57945 Transcript_29526/m.57945 type:complete len:88 (+) Transcript_29526:71-334(+)